MVRSGVSWNVVSCLTVTTEDRERPGERLLQCVGSEAGAVFWCREQSTVQYSQLECGVGGPELCANYQLTSNTMRNYFPPRL